MRSFTTGTDRSDRPAKAKESAELSHSLCQADRAGCSGAASRKTAPACTDGGGKAWSVSPVEAWLRKRSGSSLPPSMMKPALPAQLIRPQQGKLLRLVDRQAASLLEERYEAG